MNFERSSGILLHPTSLPGRFGIGDFGYEIYDFLDFMADAKQRLWQIYPLGHTGFGDSPYQCFSAFAGNPLLISLEKMHEDGLLDPGDLLVEPGYFDDNLVDFGKVMQFKQERFQRAFSRFQQNESKLRDYYREFCEKNNDWLDDFALFMAVRHHYQGRSWPTWDDDIKLRRPDGLTRYRKQLTDEIEYIKFLQFLFFRQWREIRDYAAAKDIKIIGDLPIFVAADSADAWSHPEIFLLDADRRPTKVAGVPPDYFSVTGQLWGNPLYNWDELKKSGYTWWLERFRRTFEQVDIVRVDHFRGFAAYWAVPFGETTALYGTWEFAPGHDFFAAVEKAMGKLPVIAEDLGVITPDVEKLRDDFNLPGMKVLQFAFDDGKDNDYLPHNYQKNCVVYTGTHDNDTTLGWYQNLPEKDKHYVRVYLQVDGHDICWDLIRLAWMSTAVFAIAPLQDLMQLGSEARMNTPGKAVGNWGWRYQHDMLTEDMKIRLSRLTQTYHRYRKLEPKPVATYDQKYS